MWNYHQVIIFLLTFTWYVLLLNTSRASLRSSVETMADLNEILLFHGRNIWGDRLHKRSKVHPATVSYALYHATRKTFSNVKDSLSKEWTPSPCNATYPCLVPNATWNDQHMFDQYSAAEPYLGLLDTLFMFAYAIGLYFSGFLSDRLDLRKVLSCGMVMSAMLVFTFGALTQYVHYYNKYFYGFIWFLNGLVQSSGWPCVVAIMGNWFTKSNRGLIFGVWSSCASVGNIIGALLTSVVINYGYEKAFLVTSLSLFCGGILAFIGIVSSPHEIGLQMKEDLVVNVDGNEDTSDLLPPPDSPDNREVEDCEEHEDVEEVENSVKAPKSNGINFFSAFLLPGVLLYSLAYACLKLVNYAFFFWLPYYLTNNFKWDDSKADKLSTWYDVGGIIGGIVFGTLSDRLSRRAPVLAAMLAIAPFTLWAYLKSSPNVAVNCALMAIVGVFINGASNIISSAVAADLGKQPQIGQNTRALATVTGIIDGTGSIGAAIGQYLVAVIQLHLGWQYVFYFFIVMVLLTLLCILPMTVRELWSFRIFRCCNLSSRNIDTR